MGKMIYLITTSVDGYVADRKGSFDWATPNMDEHRYINEILGNVGTFLLGRKLYETMAVWDQLPADGPNSVTNEFARIWRGANKVVFSRTIQRAKMQNTRTLDEFDPAMIRWLKSESAKDLDIGGPHLAAQAIEAGLVEEIHQFIAPIIIGGGNFWLPHGPRWRLQLVDMRKFDNGNVHLQYSVSG